MALEAAQMRTWNLDLASYDKKRLRQPLCDQPGFLLSDWISGC